MHTKGEWVQEGSLILSWRSKDGDGYVICKMAEPFPKSGLVEYVPLEIGSPEFHQQMANARLIVAAPDMYEALSKVKELLKGYVYSQEDGVTQLLGEDYEETHILRQVEEVMRKAEGK